MAQRELQILLELKDNASKELKGFQGKIQKLQPTFRKMAVAGTAALTGIAAGANKAIESSSDLEESINAVNVVFGEGADEILRFGETAAENVGLATSEFNQLSVGTGALLKDTGISMDEVANLTKELTVRGADLASVFNTDVNDAMSAINQALRGETEAIRRYAGDVTDATLETFRMSEGIEKSVSEMTQQEKRLLRVQLLLKQTSDVQGDFANTSDSLANTQRILNSQLENMSAAIGNSLKPILADILTTIAPIITQITEWVKENPKLTKTIILAAGALAGLVAVIGAVGIAIAAFNPIVAGIVLAITGLTAAGIALANNWGKIKKWFRDTWDGIKLIFSSAIDWIMDKLDPFINAIEFIISGVKSVGSGIKSLGSGIVSGVKNLIPQLAEGGVVTKPTIAMVGEAGAEAVVPLDKAGGMGNNITININGGTYLDREAGRKIADSLSEELRRRLRF